MSERDQYEKRLQRLARSLKRERLDALLVWDRANTRYLTGFCGSASLICLAAEDGCFLTDFRYITVAKATVPQLRVMQTRPGAKDQLARILKRLGARRIGFEGSIPYHLYDRWRKALDGAELVEATALLRRLRECKARGELRRILRAQRVAEKALEQILAFCKPGITERELARRLIRAIEDGGADGVSFDPIVASGPNSALPHAHPTDRRLKKGDFVTFDLGACVNGYASDMTRTVVIGRASARQRRVYQIVLDAQRKAISRVREGTKGRTVDRAARAHIEAQGFGKNFGHGTGHGIGLEVHEAPALGLRSKDVLKAGMVVTVEPGIYIRRWGGVRIEDMVLVKRGGREVLGRFPTQLIECPID